MFRAILPNPSATSPPSAAHLPSPPQDPKPITTACQACRRRKTRCDGGRPCCSRCLKKRTPCEYENHPAKDKAEQVKNKAKALEKIYHQLQSRPTREAAELLSHIRSGADVTSALEVLADAVDTPSSISSAHTAALHSVGSTPMSAADPSQTSDAPYSVLAQDVDDVGPGGDATRSEESPAHPITPVGQPAPPNISTLDNIPLLTAFPSRAVSEHSIRAFFSCSGKLFHVFSKAQGMEIVEDVFGSAPAKDAKSKMCEMCCVAAVGTQYAQRSTSSELGKYYYNMTKFLLDDLIEADPLRAIKVCTLLVMFNALDKRTVAMAYVELGLSLARQRGLHTRYRPPEISFSQWIDYKKAWRTLMFFGSWLSSTLGYLSGNEWMAGKVLLAEMEIQGERDIEDIVQTEMAKIAVLKADILRANLTFKELTILSIETITKDLRQWYDDLPTEMHLANARSPDITTELRRTIYFVHLLYLGALMLLHRRLVSHFVHTGVQNKKRDLLNIPFEKASQYIHEGPVAAKQSARILGLLMAEDGVFKRCWLCIFQAYTSCTIILQGVAQKQLHRFPKAEWEDDLVEAGKCIEVLSYCGELDPVAQGFYETLSNYFDALRSAAATYSECIASADHGPRSSHTKGYLLAFPPGDSHLHRLCRNLTKLVCTPFRGPAVNDAVATAAADSSKYAMSWTVGASRYEYPSIIEHLDWSFESSLPVDWDSVQEIRDDELANDMLSTLRAGRFLGSSAPSGWDSCGTKRRRDDSVDDVLVDGDQRVSC